MKKSLIFFVSLLLLLANMALADQSVQAASLSDKLAGRILLQVEGRGEAWYLEPVAKERYYLGRPADALRVMSALGLGISEADFAHFENSVPARLRGRILLRVMKQGEAYYADPVQNRLVYLARPAEALALMRQHGLGISNRNLNQIRVAFASTPLPDLPLQNRFQGRLVYGIAADTDVDRWQADCAARGGYFNNCGSICGPEAEMCAEVCAYTCEERAPIVGGDKDEHGCIGSAGYTWCEPKNKCLRIWEEACYASSSEEIAYLLAKKQARALAEVQISNFVEDNGFARGSVKYGSGAQSLGGLFLARKVGNTWELVYDGNGSVDCAELRNKYGFPNSILVPNFCEAL